MFFIMRVIKLKWDIYTFWNLAPTRSLPFFFSFVFELVGNFLLISILKVHSVTVLVAKLICWKCSGKQGVHSEFTSVSLSKWKLKNYLWSFKLKSNI